MASSPTMIADTAGGVTCPYPGLRPFRADEFLVFFGRDEQVDQLLVRLGRQRLVAVVGASGCGKSSLVRAGLIPSLNTGLMSAAGSRWAVATMRPGRQPMRRLAESLLDNRVLGEEWSSVAGAAALLRSALRRGPLSLAEVIESSPPPDGRTLLLVVDQFEEIFRYRRDGARDEADAFVALMLASSRQDRVPIYIVLTMRSDYIGECAVFEGLPEALNEGLFLAPRLTHEQRREAIESPARVFDGRVEEGLVARLLNDLGSGPDRLPLMQHTLMRMWRTACQSAQVDGEVVLTLEAYHAIGGIDAALSGQADAAFLALDDEGRRIAEVLFRSLCERTAAGGDIRRPIPVETIARVAGAAVDAVVAVADVFRQPDLCFLTPSLPEPIAAETWLDITHESLIRQWDRLSGWVKDEADSAEIYSRLRQWAARWAEGRAGLWGAPDLDLALDWKDRARPTVAWADRYCGGFELAMRFLEASRAWRVADREAEEEDRRRRAAEREAWLLMEEELKRRKEQEEAERRLALESQARAMEQAQAVVRQRRLVRWLLVAAALSFCLSIIAGIALVDARQKQIIAKVLRLAAQSRAVRETNPKSPQLALLLAREAYREALSQQMTLVEPEQALRDALAHSGGDPLPIGQSDVSTLSFASDGRLATAGNDGTVRLWDIDRPKSPPVTLEGNKTPILALAIAADGRHLAAGADTTVQLWDMNRPREPVSLGGHTMTILALAFGRDGRLATAGDDRTVRIWDIARPQSPPRVLPVPDRSVLALAFAPDGRLAAAGTDKTVRIWDLGAGGGGPVTLRGHERRIRSLAFADDGRLASAGDDGTVRVWDDRRPKPALLHRMQVPDKKVLTLAFDRDGRLAAAGTDKTVRLWDKDLTSLAPSLAGHEGQIISMSFNRRDGRLATAGKDEAPSPVRLWDLGRPTGQPEILRGHQSQVVALAFSRDGRLVTASDDREVRIWAPGRPRWASIVLPLPRIPHDILALAFAPDGRRAVASDEEGVLVWDADRPKALPERLRGPVGPTQALAFGRDGRLATAGLDGKVRLWNIDAAGSPPIVLDPGQGGLPVRALAFAPGGRRLASAGDGPTIRVWDIRRPGEPEMVVTRELQNPITDLAFVGDDRLAAINSDRVAFAWSLSGTPGPGVQLNGPEFMVDSLAPTADGRLAIGGPAGAALLPKALEAHRDRILLSDAEVTGLAFGEKGRYLAGGLANGDVVLWSLWPEELMDEAGRIAGRPFEPGEKEQYLGQRSDRP